MTSEEIKQITKKEEGLTIMGRVLLLIIVIVTLNRTIHIVHGAKKLFSNRFSPDK